MEEKILAKLDSMQNQMNKMEQKMNKMDEEISGIKKEAEGIKGEVESIKSETESLKGEIGSIKKEISEIKEDVGNLTDQMFAMEEDYGRKINIMFEELMAKNERTEGTERNLMALQRRIDKNSAFIFSHEKRITTLEKAKK